MKIAGNKRADFLRSAAVLCCAMVAIFMMATGYLRVVESEEQERVNQVVQESAIQSVTLIREHLNNDMLHIEQIGLNLGRYTASITAPETLKHLNKDRYIGDIFLNITTATPDGTLYGPDGTVAGNIAEHKHFQRSMAGETAISDMEASVVDQKDIICVTAPIPRDGEIIGIVRARFRMDSLTRFLSAESFGGRGYSYMVNTDGRIFARSDNPNANHDNDFTNIFESFEANDSVTEEELVEMEHALQAGEAGWIAYRWDGDSRTMNYMPVGVNDWYFLSVLPNDIVASRAMTLTTQAFALTAVLLLILIAMGFYADKMRRKGRNELEAVHRELLTIYNTIPGGAFKCQADDDFTLIDANDGFYKITGYTREELKLLFDDKLVRLMRPADVQRVQESLRYQQETGETTRDELSLVGADGTVTWILLGGTVVEVPGGETVVYCSFTDISELKSTQEALRDAKQRYDLIMAETQDVVFEWDLENHTIRHSKIYEQKFGYDCIREDFPQSILDRHLVPPEDEAAFSGLYRQIAEGARFASAEYRIQKADGDFLWCHVSVMAASYEDSRVTRAVGIITDIEKAKQELQAVTEQAQRDAMTGLYNKVTTQRHIEQQILGGVTEGALLTVDIDNFKDVNDTLGHGSGDLALIEVARQLRLLFRSGDIVGRVGGDEFMVFVAGMVEGEDLEQKLRDISTVFNWSFCKNDIEYGISCSIGVALYPRDGADFTALSKRADAALYFAKQNGKNRFAIYSDEMQRSIHGVEPAKPRRRGKAPQSEA
ncbi:MAG: diguanylate cyclase [Oscillospiraceae bacterium]